MEEPNNKTIRIAMLNMYFFITVNFKSYKGNASLQYAV
jgi:hypothetical protein